jgi:hypothetical protein
MNIIVLNGREQSFLFTIASDIFHELISEQLTKRLILLYYRPSLRKYICRLNFSISSAYLLRISSVLFYLIQCFDYFQVNEI